MAKRSISKRADKARTNDAPRNLTPSEQERLSLLRRKQMVRGEGGKEEEITLSGAILRKAIQQALAGSVYAQRSVLMFLGEAEAVENAQLRESAEYWRQAKARWRRELEAWLEQGNSEDEFYPHPDDIVIGHDDSVRFLGPLDAEEMAKVSELERLRDVFLLQAKYEERAGVLTEAAQAEGGSSALLLAMIMNNALPQRLRWDDAPFMASYLSPTRWKTRRDAERAVQTAWQTVGVKAMRGTILPPLDKMRRFIEALKDLVQRCRREAMAGNDGASPELPGELAQLFEELRE